MGPGRGTTVTVQPLSKGEINRAGEVLKACARVQPALFGPEPPGDPDVEHAKEVLTAFRRQWEAGPTAALPRMNAALQELVGGLDASVSNRLKRANRIVNKLVSLDGMKLARMDDIGGCRIILPNLATLRDVEDQVRSRFAGELKPAAGHDYVTTPKETGYRAVHLILRCEGLLVEVQLRTALQHVWAEAVEANETRSGDMFKRGEGDADVLAALRSFSDLLAELDGRPAHLVAQIVDALKHP